MLKMRLRCDDGNDNGDGDDWQQGTNSKSGQDDDDDDNGDRNGDADGDTVLPVRVGKSDVTFHGDADCHVLRTHLKMFLGRITVMRFFL